MLKFDIENSYGDVVLYDSFDEITADVSFGEGSIERVNYMECNLQYSDLEIERLSNELIIDGSFSNLLIDEVDTDFKNIDIDLDYSIAHLVK